MQKRVPVTVEPKHGDTFSKFVFAWWWHRVGDKAVIFEKYEEIYAYVVTPVDIMLLGQPKKGSYGEWVKIGEALL